MGEGLFSVDEEDVGKTGHSSGTKGKCDGIAGLKTSQILVAFHFLAESSVARLNPQKKRSRKTLVLSPCIDSMGLLQPQVINITCANPEDMKPFNSNPCNGHLKAKLL